MWRYIGGLQYSLWKQSHWKLLSAGIKYFLAIKLFWKYFLTNLSQYVWLTQSNYLRITVWHLSLYLTRLRKRIFYIGFPCSPKKRIGKVFLVSGNAININTGGKRLYSQDLQNNLPNLTKQQYSKILHLFPLDTENQEVGSQGNSVKLLFDTWES